jgi:iron(III) transport system substrate-binding protein
LLAGAVALLLAACAPARPTTEPAPNPTQYSVLSTQHSPAPSGWDQVVEAARQEGTVVVYGPPGATYRPALVGAFESAYPGIKVQGSFGVAAEFASRLITERTAGRNIPDVFVAGTATLVATLKDAGAIVPLQSTLVLPEVLDESAWFENRLWWVDSEEPYTVFQFEAQVNSVAFHHKQQVDPAQFKSYWDLLDPKWKGRVVATDVRQAGPGAALARWMYKHPQLGPTYLERLYGEMDLVLSSDRRQPIDWVAQGQYPLGILLSGLEAKLAEEQGLAIGTVPAEQFREGAPLTAGSGAVALLDRAPHPNAAKVYVNWLLSRDGQIAWQRETKEPSLRADIPQTGLLLDPPRRGQQYDNANAEQYARVTSAIIEPLVTRALQRAGRQ